MSFHAIMRFVLSLWVAKIIFKITNNASDIFTDFTLAYSLSLQVKI